MPTEVPNSDKKFSSTINGVLGDAVTVTCDPGHTTTGVVGGDSVGTATCQADGTFSVVACTPVSCGTFPPVANSDSVDSITGSAYGDVIAVTCNDGYSGSGQTVCQADGTFSSGVLEPNGFTRGGQPTGCTPVGCPAHSSGANVPSGCYADPGYTGSVTPTAVAPYYVSDIAAVGCPAHSSGADVPSGCTADPGYSGSVTPTAEAPYYASTIIPVPCDAGSTGTPPDCSTCDAPGYQGTSTWDGAAWSACATVDACGVPNGDGSSCADKCGVPNGDGSSCPGVFETKSELTAAVDEWVADRTAAEATYGAALSNWDTSRVEDLSYIFSQTRCPTCPATFNSELNWDTSRAKSLVYTFYDADRFNQQLDWDTSKVTDMGGTFASANTFTQLLDWDISSVTNFGYMVTLLPLARLAPPRGAPTSTPAHRLVARDRSLIASRPDPPTRSSTTCRARRAPRKPSPHNVRDKGVVEMLYQTKRERIETLCEREKRESPSVAG